VGRKKNRKHNSDGTSLALRTLSSAFFILDSQLRFTYANPAYCSLVHKNEMQIVGKDFAQIHPNGEDSTLYRSLKKAWTNRVNFTFEDYEPELDLWIDYHVTVSDSTISVLALDITTKKNIYLKLAADQQEAQYLLDNSAQGLGHLGLDGRWHRMNAKFCEITGINKNRVTSSHWNDLSFANDIKKDEKSFSELLHGEKNTFFSERQIIRPNGSVIWVQLKISLVRNVNRQPLCFVVALDEITARKEAEESLNFALQAAQIGNWDYDAINDQTRRSTRFDKIFGYETAKPTWGYVDFMRHIHPEDRDRADAQFRSALARGEDYIIDCRIVWPDDSIHWVSMRGRVYVNRQGRAMRMAGLVLDITAEKLFERELNEAKTAAEDANREKSNFLANMSHEIRTPLGAILGFTDLLSENSITDEKRKEYLKVIRRNGRNLSELIGDILDLSKIEAGCLELESQSISINDLIESVMTLLKTKADDKKLDLVVRRVGSIPRNIKTDPLRLRQILLNIIGNAIKFTNAGSITVTIESSHTPDGKDRNLFFTVKDTGRGISEEETLRLFQPFTQADSSTTRKYGGTGLGLALSQKLARALGGDLILSDSVRGLGSTFVISIPLVPDYTETVSLPSEPKVTPKNSRSQPLQGLRVLLAEDSPDNQFLIRQILAKSGIFLEVADDGAAAVEMATQDNYDLVLMDMQMPKLDGYEATRELRKRGLDLPIIALTAHAMRQDREKCLAAGCSEYLSKPINPSLLYQVLTNISDQIRH
jgi:PAS domain S-box-containing protein